MKYIRNNSYATFTAGIKDNSPNWANSVFKNSLRSIPSLLTGRKEIFRRCCLKARQSNFMELTYDENSLAKALSYLQTMLSDIVDHSAEEEEREYQLLASQLFKFPPLPSFSNSSIVSPVKKSRSFDGTTKLHGDMAKDMFNNDSEGMYTKLDRKRHKLRTELFDTLAEHFPSDMTHPKGNLIDLIPHPVDLS